MIKVCARYCGTTILLEEFNTKEEAEEFMKHDYILAYSDEFEDADDDEVIYSDEMFIDESDDIPFSEPVTVNETEYWDELPF